MKVQVLSLAVRALGVFSCIQAEWGTEHNENAPFIARKEQKEQLERNKPESKKKVYFSMEAVNQKPQEPLHDTIQLKAYPTGIKSKRSKS